MTTRRKYHGWRRDLPDYRDLHYAAPRVARLPASHSGKRDAMTIRDQGQLGSCGGFGGRQLFGPCSARAGLKFDPSPLFIYYNARPAGEKGVDSGVEIRDVVKSLAKQGACSARTWPYKISRFAEKPPATAYAEAASHQALVYARVPRSLDQIRACLASGQQIILGFSVYSGFESATVERTGNVQLPKAGESMLGGHCVTLFGYNDRTGRVTFPNSYGTTWGANGWGSLPYDYLLDDGLSGDFWTLYSVEV